MPWFSRRFSVDLTQNSLYRETASEPWTGYALYELDTSTMSKAYSFGALRGTLTLTYANMRQQQEEYYRLPIALKTLMDAAN